MPSLGGWEWVILALIALLLFGGSRLAGIGKNTG
ncbi:MAG: twin-arginine translocase TatA/TatE family subunit, partial [Phenylobacterium zucineum]